jgi:hypothetical protein
MNTFANDIFYSVFSFPLALRSASPLNQIKQKTIKPKLVLMAPA